MAKTRVTLKSIIYALLGILLLTDIVLNRYLTLYIGQSIFQLDTYSRLGVVGHVAIAISILGIGTYFIMQSMVNIFPYKHRGRNGNN